MATMLEEDAPQVTQAVSWLRPGEVVMRYGADTLARVQLAHSLDPRSIRSKLVLGSDGNTIRVWLEDDVAERKVKP